MISNRQQRGLSERFRPVAEALEGRSLMTVGQFSLFIPNPAVGSAGTSPVRGGLPDGSIEVQQFDLGTSNTTTIGTTTGGAGAGKVQFQPLEVIIPVGAQSSGLFQAQATGSHFNTMMLTLRDSAARVYETIQFKLVVVVSDVISGSEAAGTAQEDVKFAYGAIQESLYNPANPPTAPPISQTSFSQVTNTATFDVSGITALSLPTAQVSVASAKTVKALAVSPTIPTTIKLTVAKSHSGTTVLTAKVTSKQGVPTGDVTFYSGKVELGQAVVGTNGKATLSVPTALIGKTQPFAIFSGGPTSTFQPATTVGNEAVFKKSFQTWLGRTMSQDEWVLTSIWSQQGFTPSKMTSIYKSLATSVS